MTPSKIVPWVLVCVLALVAATSTSFAAGLAAGSVGTAQLRSKAVTASKIAPHAVSGSTVRDGSLTTRDLAAGTLPPRSYTVNRSSADADEVQVLALRGLRFSFVCDATQRLSRLVVTPVSGRMDRTGIEVVRSGSTQYPRSVVYPANTLTVLGEPAAPDLSASTAFEGILQAAGSPAVRVTVGVQWSPSSAPTSCLLRLVATPTA